VSNVVTVDRWSLTSENLARLREDGLTVHRTFPTDAELGLPEPCYGEQIVGTLTDDEFSLFVEYALCAKQMSDMAKTEVVGAVKLVGQKLIDLSDQMQNLDPSKMSEKDMNDMLQKLKTIDPREEQIKTLHRLEAKKDMIKNIFYWNVHERFDLHDWSTGVRSGRRFVKLKKREK
jgi:hypothetical protein